MGMNWILVLLTVIASISFASITSGTLHRTDATRVERNFTTGGISSHEFEVNIATIDRTTDYYLAWEGVDYIDSGDGLLRLMLSVICVGDAINDASWTPTYLFVGFEDTMIKIRSSRVTYLRNHIGEMSDIEAVEYLLRYAVEIDYAF